MIRCPGLLLMNCCLATQDDIRMNAFRSIQHLPRRCAGEQLLLLHPSQQPSELELLSLELIIVVCHICSLRKG